jgi:hypothetical protein
MRGVFAATLLFFFLVPALAHADPRCGDVENDIVDDIWDIADDIRFYRDYRSPIRDVCEGMEALEDFQRKNTLTKEENDALDDRAEALVEKVETQLQDMHGDLRAIKIWLRAGTDNDRERIRRYVNIKDARRRANEMAGLLEQSRQDALALVGP